MTAAAAMSEIGVVLVDVVVVVVVVFVVADGVAFEDDFGASSGGNLDELPEIDLRRDEPSSALRL